MLQVPCSQIEAHSGERSIITGDSQEPPPPPAAPASPLPPSIPLSSLTPPEMLGKEARTQNQGSPAQGAGDPRSGAGRREEGVWVQAQGEGGGEVGDGLSPPVSVVCSPN